MKAKSIAVAIGMMLATSVWADAPSADTTTPAAPAPTSIPMAMEMPMPDAGATRLQKVDENLNKMHALVGQLKDATGSAERQKLMMEYMNAQHENMMLTMMLARDVMGMGMGPGMGMMGGKKSCEMDGMGKRGCDREGMGMTGKRDCGMGSIEGMGMMGRMGGMGMMGGGMAGMRDEALAARVQSLEKRLDVLQDMMRMMIGR